MGNNRELRTLRDALVEQLSGVQDPRVKGRCAHKLEDILMLSFCALLCGTSDYVGIYLFGINRLSWLSGFLEFPNGIPSHDTIRRVMSLIDPLALEAFLKQWAREYCESKKAKKSGRIMLDGKSIRGTEKDVLGGKRPLHLLNVFDHEHGIVLAQTKANGSGISELQAALAALDILDLKKVLVSVDAGLSSKKITSKIAEKRGFYVVPIKSNEKHIFDILCAHDGALSKPSGSKDNDSFYRTEEKNHGRNERRECRISHSKKMLNQVQAYRAEVKTIFKITRHTSQKDKRPRYIANENGIRSTSQSCYYISNKELTAQQCLEHVRDHWEIENKLHWSLDVTFGEDQSMIRDKQAARSLSALRRMAYNLFATAPDPLERLGVKMKVGRRNKMLIAAQDPQYLQSLLFNFAGLAEKSV